MLKSWEITTNNKLQVGELINVANGTEDGVKKLLNKFKELNMSKQEKDNIFFLFYQAKYFLQIMVFFIEIYPQIHIFSEFRSKKRAKTTNKDTIAIKRKRG